MARSEEHTSELQSLCLHDAFRSWWAPFAARYLKAKAVLTDHCADHPVHPSKFVSFIARYVDKLLIPLIAKFYEVVTVTNQATFNFLRSLGVEWPDRKSIRLNSSLFAYTTPSDLGGLHLRPGILRPRQF